LPGLTDTKQELVTGSGVSVARLKHGTQCARASMQHCAASVLAVCPRCACLVTVNDKAPSVLRKMKRGTLPPETKRAARMAWRPVGMRWRIQAVTGCLPVGLRCCWRQRAGRTGRSPRCAPVRPCVRYPPESCDSCRTAA
jgi:hypothetical protein